MAHASTVLVLGTRDFTVTVKEMDETELERVDKGNLWQKTLKYILRTSVNVYGVAIS